MSLLSLRPAVIGACLLTLALALTTDDRALAGDWPQILGPMRDGKAVGERIAPWPTAGPRTLWERKVGSGFAGLAVVKDRALLFHRVGADLLLEALAPDTGKTLWKAKFETNYRSSISSDDGPRCVPLVHAEHVYVCGPAGELGCVRLSDGKQVWLRQINQEFDAPEGYFGAGSSPLVEGDKLLVNVGGKNGAGIVAFALDDGKTLWKSTDEAASYSSPVAATIDGVRHIVFVTRLNVVSLDPNNGKVRFRFPFGARGPTVNAANPLLLGNHLFVSASYGVGAQWAKIEPARATAVWESDDVMSSQYTTCVEKDGVLYGIDGRQDIGPARLRAFDPTTGKVLWTEEGFGTGNCILAGGKLLILKTDGELVLIDPSSKAYRALASAKVLADIAQALPALCNGKLYVRDTHTLKCLEVGKP